MKRKLLLIVASALFVLGLVWVVALSGEGEGEGDIDTLAAPDTGTISTEARYTLERDASVPSLPFDDNPDPNQCGIPIRWGDNGQAWLTGEWEGEIIQSEVLAYDSHLRLNITASAPHGSEVQIVLYQENPVLDYYFVKIFEGDTSQEGWVPEPFISFDPVL